MEVFDVVVIGGGPAGMMAAGRAAECGATVALLEKNNEPGKKLLITGKGRCNLAHDEEDPLKLAEAYGRNGRFLLSGLNRFGLADTLAFFKRQGLEAVTERGRRIFPVEGKNAAHVRAALVRYMEDNGVRIFTGREVTTLEAREGHITRAVTDDFDAISGRSFVVATGGLSYPTTGSTGDGYRWAKDTGHRITPTEPSICPVDAREAFCKELQGLSLRNVSLSVWQKGKKKDERFGEMLFTHFGISGPIVMDLSRDLAKLLKKGPVTLFLDLKPALDEATLDARLVRDFREHHGKEIRTVVRGLVPKAMASVILRLADIHEDRKVDEITREERQNLLETLKSIAITPTSLLGYRWAIVTAGGVSLKDVDPRTMGSKKVPNLFFAGEVLDLDGPTGGFNLQACWTTGYVAGEAAAGKP